MVKIDFRPPTAADIHWVADHLRDADRAECAAVGITDGHHAVGSSVACSALSWCAAVDGEPAFIAGAAPLGSMLSGVGAPWLLGTPLAPQHARALMRRYSHYIGQMLNAFPHLLNFVHAENHLSIGWLKRMGFTVHPAVPFGPRGALFHRFEQHHHV
jgi:hypothetical protein